MPRFEYKVRDKENRIFIGTIEGAGINNVADFLDDKNLSPLYIEELNFDGSKKNQTFLDKVKLGWHKKQNKVPYKNVVFFTRQLATMVEGGVPLTRALEQLARSEKPVFQRIIQQIAADISTGHAFSDAIARHPGAFDNMYVAVVHSGEISGSLDMVLDQMASYMENVEALRAKVKAAMLYPAFISLFVTLMIIGILWFLVPIFKDIYSSFGKALPLPTLILISISDFVKSYILLLFLGCIALVSGFKALMTRSQFKLYVHAKILKFPVFGNILKKNIYAVFCRTMALLMDSGTPILQAIEMAAAAVDNKVYAASLEKVRGYLNGGELLSSSLEMTQSFPPLVTQLIATGEESGKIDELLRKAAGFYEREIRNIVDSLAAIIEPFLIITLGGVVGVILIALYLPIFSMGSLIRGG